MASNCWTGVGRAVGLSCLLPRLLNGWELSVDTTAAEQRQVNDLMSEHGCHTCDTDDSGATSGNAIVDHQPPQSLRKTTEL